jgi:hypothetical protein
MLASGWPMLANECILRCMMAKNAGPCWWLTAIDGELTLCQLLGEPRRELIEHNLK